MLSIILIVIAIGLINFNPLMINKLGGLTRFFVFALSLFGFTTLIAIYPSESVWLAIGIIVAGSVLLFWLI